MKDHPTVKDYYARLEKQPISTARPPLDVAWLRELCLGAGADDVGFVEFSRPVLDDQRADILAAFPATKSLISLVFKMNREPIRTPARSAANLEFHSSYEHANSVARKIVAVLQTEGVRALNPSAGFPMEMDKFPGKIWIVSHKPVAVAAGLGQMGIHRNVIHPRFGNFIVLDTILIDQPLTAYCQPIAYNPCLSCKLCVAACPVGAIAPNGDFNFVNCSTHNYREFMGGFHDWMDTITDSDGHKAYRRNVTDGETASMWQSLAFGPNYKAAYCLAVCPAGEDVIAPFLANRPQFLAEMVKPLTEKLETIYVIKGSDAEAHVAKRFPHKSIKQIHSGIRPRTIASFARGLSLVFQPGRAKGLTAVYHFTFTGKESAELTVRIENQTLHVQPGHHGTASLRIIADGPTWLGFLAKEKSLVWALLRRRIIIKGSPRLLLAFGRCFPS